MTFMNTVAWQAAKAQRSKEYFLEKNIFSCCPAVKAVASEAICKWGGTMPARSSGRNFFDVPPTFILCPPPHMRGHNDCLLPTERQLK